MAIFGMKYLDRIIGFVGSFVGVFELIVLPALMFLVLDFRRHYMSNNMKIVFIAALCVIIPIYLLGAYFSIRLK
jgi:hypothetical protein